MDADKLIAICEALENLVAVYEMLCSNASTPATDRLDEHSLSQQWQALVKQSLQNAGNAGLWIAAQRETLLAIPGVCEEELNEIRNHLQQFRLFGQSTSIASDSFDHLYESRDPRPANPKAYSIRDFKLPEAAEAANALTARIRDHLSRANVGGWRLRPFEKTGPTNLPVNRNEEVIDAVQRVLTGWDGDNWDAVYRVLWSDELEDAQIRQMTIGEIRQHFAIRQRAIRVKLGGMVNTNENTIVAIDGATNGEIEIHGDGRAARTPQLKTPSADALSAWRLKHLGGLKSQSEIAQALSNELKRRISQGQVSRWLAEAEAFTDAGGIISPLPEKPMDKPVPVDPAVLDYGEREDHRTKAQRKRREDSDD